MKLVDFYLRNLSEEELEIKRIRDKCLHQNFKKNGKSASGKQKYLCKDCGATLCIHDKTNRISWKEIKKAYHLRQQNLSLRQIAKKLGYAHSTIYENMKYWDEVNGITHTPS